MTIAEHLMSLLQLVYETICYILAIRPATSLKTFKKHLKTHLFQSSYSR